MTPIATVKNGRTRPRLYHHPMVAVSLRETKSISRSEMPTIIPLANRAVMAHAEESMPKTRSLTASLLDLLNGSSRPIYAIDGHRRIVYCNKALVAWLELELDSIAGRLVEYHSEPHSDSRARDEAAPLTDLCPPPRALNGEPCKGMISCALPDGRLAHRHADFIPLNSPTRPRYKNRNSVSVFVLLGEHDLSPQELTSEISVDTSADELHRIIRRFRRAYAGNYAIESFLGPSTTMQKVRAQIAAAAASGANTLISGHPGTGRGHIARAIHYHAAADPAPKLLPVDCALTTDEQLRRALDVLRSSIDDPRQRPTLLLENLEHLNPQLQTQLFQVFRHNAFRARVIATCSRHTGLPLGGAAASAKETDNAPGGATHVQPDGDLDAPATFDGALVDLISTITIETPSLTQRLEDLPLLAQCFLESCNRNSGKQVGSIRLEALDQLALYPWPGELDELQQVIAAAHAACNSHEITLPDLPPVIHHAAQAAARPRKRSERIVLDDLLDEIEREAITRALAEANGNKTEAATMLGMTRPRFYRRLVQLGMVSEKETDQLQPEFIEQPAEEESQ